MEESKDGASCIQGFNAGQCYAILNVVQGDSKLYLQSTMCQRQTLTESQVGIEAVVWTVTHRHCKVSPVTKAPFLAALQHLLGTMRSRGAKNLPRRGDAPRGQDA